MQEIKAGESLAHVALKAFSGLRENADGDTKLNYGEMARMENFRLTRHGHLQIRPGRKTVFALNGEVTALWSGLCLGREVLLAAIGGGIYLLDAGAETAQRIGTCARQRGSFFAFEGKVYLLDGENYQVWTGEGDFAPVTPYVPIVAVSCTPEGSGVLLERVNRLTPLRRVRFSPDGESRVFTLPEKEAEEVSAVSGGENWTFADGKLTFAAAPPAGVDTLEVTYRCGEGAAEEVAAMRFCELYGGLTDSRAFLYGDGTNRVIYSGLDENGRPTAAYFPDLNECRIGEENTPVTALIRQYSAMLAFKPTGAWRISHDILTLADGSTADAFYVRGVNRDIGAAAYGAALVENDPVTLCRGGAWRWAAGRSASLDETNARLISDAARDSMGEMDLAKATLFDHGEEREVYVLAGGTALVYNYAVDGWYRYENFPFVALAAHRGKLYGAHSGGIACISRAYRNDDGEAICAYAETGSMDLGSAWRMKYSPRLYVAIEPESNARVQVSVESNRRSDHGTRSVVSSLANFLHVDFNHFSFATNRKPQVKRVKIKVKKAAYYKLVFSSRSASATATVLRADIGVRYGSAVK